MKQSNNVLGILNIITFLISIPIIYIAAKAVSKAGSTDGGCASMLMKPLLIFGIFIMVVSLLGVMGACSRNTTILWVYLIVMLILLISYVLFYAISLMIVRNGSTDRTTSSGDYKLSGHSSMLQNRVKDKENWNKIMHCLKNVCDPLAKKGKISMNDFIKLKEDDLAPLVIGCCMPSKECGFTYESPTVWKKNNSTSGASSKPDCKLWENDLKVMCFHCETCKAGVLRTIENAFLKTRFFQALFLCFLVIVYNVGCCAFRNRKNKPDYGSINKQ